MEQQLEFWQLGTRRMSEILRVVVSGEKRGGVEERRGGESTRGLQASCRGCAEPAELSASQLTVSFTNY